jgi:polar amino acid transport system substrate-binding protein
MEENMKKTILKLVIALLTMALLTACTGGEQRSTYEKIMEEGNMTFAMSGAYPPFNYIDENGEVIGFDVDIGKAIGNEMGVEAEAITADFDGIVAGLNGNRFDMIIGSMAITEEREREVSFTTPYYYDGAQFFAQADSELESIEDLENGQVGVVTGTTFHENLQDMDNIEILQFSSDVDNIMAVEQGRIDGMVTGRFVGLRAPEEYGVDIVPVGPILYPEDVAIALRQEDTELLEVVNKALQTIVDNGVYQEISNKWFG